MLIISCCNMWLMFIHKYFTQNSSDYHYLKAWQTLDNALIFL